MVINPVVYDYNNHGCDIFSRNLDERVVYICGEINDEMAASVVAQLIHLSSISDDDIQIFINSPGGSVFAGFAILDTMQYIKPDVSTVCMGYAASMGAILLSGGTQGKRSILRHGEVMIHQPLGGVQGQASDILIEAEHISRLKEVSIDILSENCHRNREEVRRDVDRNHWMSADDALAYGIVDKII